MKKWPAWNRPICDATVALLNPLQDHWGEHYRTLVFVHDEWVERGGVWQETRRARMLRLKGWRPAPRHHAMGVRKMEELVPERGPLCYPTDIRCPACEHKRLLDSGVLGVLTVEEAKRRAAQRAQAEGLPEDAPSLLRDGRGCCADLLPQLRAAQRRGRRSAERALRAFKTDLQTPLLARALALGELIGQKHAVLNALPPEAALEHAEGSAEAYALLLYVAALHESLAQDLRD
jgi:hypothetical protein